MKNIKKLFIVLMMVVLFTTGCTHTFQDKKTEKVYTENKK